METEFEFSLPRGFVDSDGTIHRDGRMRLATALDEIESINDPRILANESYLPVILLSRVITSLGAIAPVTPYVIEHLFVSDLTYLEDLYQKVNTADQVVVGAVCPTCNTQFQLQTSPLGANAN